VRDRSSYSPHNIVSQTEGDVGGIPEVDRYARHPQRVAVSPHSCEAQLVAGLPCMADDALVYGAERVRDGTTGVRAQACYQDLA